jgi:hypothetical protein
MKLQRGIAHAVKIRSPCSVCGKESTGLCPSCKMPFCGKGCYAVLCWKTQRTQKKGGFVGSTASDEDDDAPHCTKAYWAGYTQGCYVRFENYISGMKDGDDETAFLMGIVDNTQRMSYVVDPVDGRTIAVKEEDVAKITKSPDDRGYMNVLLQRLRKVFCIDAYVRCAVDTERLFRVVTPPWFAIRDETTTIPTKRQCTHKGQTTSQQSEGTTTYFKGAVIKIRLVDCHDYNGVTLMSAYHEGQSSATCPRDIEGLKVVAHTEAIKFLNEHALVVTLQSGTVGSAKAYGPMDIQDMYEIEHNGTMVIMATNKAMEVAVKTETIVSP